MNMKREFSKKILIILGLCVIGLCLLIYILFLDIKGKNERISVIEHELSFQSNKQEYMVSMERVIQKADSDITRVNNSIIPSDGDVRFIESLETIAHDNGLSIDIDSLTFEDSRALASSSMTTLKVKAKTEGGWSGTYRFLFLIESLPIKVKIDKFTLNNIKDEANLSADKVSSRSAWQSAFEMRVLKYK